MQLLTAYGLAGGFGCVGERADARAYVDGPDSRPKGDRLRRREPSGEPLVGSGLWGVVSGVLKRTSVGKGGRGFAKQIFERKRVGRRLVNRWFWATNFGKRKWLELPF